MDEIEQIPENQGLYFQPSYDRAFEAQLERDIVAILGKAQEYCNRNTYYPMNDKGERERKVRPIADVQAFTEIRRVFDVSRLLLSGYKEEKSAVTQIDDYLKFLSKQTQLDTDGVIENLEKLSALVGQHFKQNENFRDKTHAKFVWDKELKKKLEFPAFTIEEQKYYDSIKKDWKKLCFLLTFYVVRCGGDAHILLSGPNLSGKTNTAIPFLSCCNRYLVEFWHVKKYNSEHIKQHPENADVLQRRFSITKDVYIAPDNDELKQRFISEQYQTIDINEGMEVATNVQSNKAEAVAMGIKRFTTRSYHNIVIWEYQVQQRPTAMMLEGMNFWMQKMRKRHFILSAASTLVRKKDPYYMKELDKCRTENQISFWMRYENPNYVHTFKAPKMKPYYEQVFQDHYWAEKTKQAQGERVKRSMTAGYSHMIEDIWDKINTKHTLTLLELNDELSDMGFKDTDKKSFMRDFGRYNRVRMWEDWSTKTT